MPWDITPFDDTPLYGPVLPDFRFFYEFLEVWLEEGKNLRSETNFTGIGYARRIRYLKTTPDKYIPTDENGDFILAPRE